MSRARDIAAIPGRHADNKTGLVAFFAASTSPDGWLECNGGAVSRTTYAALFAEVGDDYGVGDGSTTFNLPDLRGEFIRGWDNGRGIDAARARGSAQTDQFQGSQPGGSLAGTDYFGLVQNAGNVNSMEAIADYARVTYATANQGGTGKLEPKSDGTNGTPRVGTETRPRNIALLPCIKY